MQKIASFEDYESLKSILNANYPIRVSDVRILRNWIGCVYLAACGVRSYVLKIYRPFHTCYARNTVGIIRYLTACDYPVAPVMDTHNGEACVEIDTPAGRCAAILYPFIEGSEPDPEADLEAIAEQTGVLHSLMEQYHGEIVSHGKEYYIGRYLSILEKIGFPQSKLCDLRAYGDELWSRFDRSSAGFCHGDYHCGNMLKDKSGRYWLLDFDAACRSHPSADLAVISDDTDYFVFRQADFDKTARRLDRFKKSYEKTRGRAVSDVDVKSVFDFIAIRHYDIQATITDCQGYSMENLEHQHGWLMRWRDLCARRINF